jgi:hypothetical protein
MDPCLSVPSDTRQNLNNKEEKRFLAPLMCFGRAVFSDCGVLTAAVAVAWLARMADLAKAGEWEMAAEVARGISVTGGLSPVTLISSRSTEIDVRCGRPDSQTDAARAVGNGANGRDWTLDLKKRDNLSDNLHGFNKSPCNSRARHR